MSIIDAIKSGKKFRRQGDPHWMQIYEGRPRIIAPEGPQYVDFSVDSVMADDWEVLEPTVTITRTQFWIAVNGASSSQLGQEMRLDYPVFERLARKLGLEP